MHFLFSVLIQSARLIFATAPHSFAISSSLRVAEVFFLIVLCVETYRVCGELRGVVVDVSNPDDSGGCVGQAICGVSLHVRGLDDQGVLGDFLETDG